VSSAGETLQHAAREVNLVTGDTVEHDVSSETLAARRAPLRRPVTPGRRLVGSGGRGEPLGPSGSLVE